MADVVRLQGKGASQVIRGVTATDNSQAIAVFASGDVHLPSHGATATTAQAARSLLCLTDPEEDRERLITTKGNRTAGTCEWITEHESYRSWLAPGSQEPVLWVSGGPGMGKTILSLYLSHELQKVCGNAGDDLAYFFCTYDDGRRNNIAAILRSWIYQVLGQHGDWIWHALPRDLVENGVRLENTLSSPEAMWLMLLRLLSRYTRPRRLVLLLDGLDECDEPSVRFLLDRLPDLASKMEEHVDLRVIVVSRPLVGFWNLPRIKLDPDHQALVSGDVGLFIKHQVDKLSQSHNLEPEFCDYIQSQLSLRSEGTFLWVGFAAQELHKQPNPSRIRQVVEDLPTGLDRILARILRQIPEAERLDAALILTWVALAERPLTILEVAGIIQSRPVEGISVKQATRDALDSCGPFLKINEAQHVTLVHLSAKDFLFGDSLKNDASLKAFQIDISRAQLTLASTCLDVLERDRRWDFGLDLPWVFGLDLQGDAHVPEVPLLGYAAVHWHKHAGAVRRDHAALFNLHRPFFSERFSARERWNQAYNNAFGQSDKLPKGSSVLEIAARFHLYHLAVAATGGTNPFFIALRFQKMRSRKASSQNEQLTTALCIACATGQLDLVQLLVSRGAGVNSEMILDFDIWTPIRAAHAYGDQTIISYLVEHGARMGSRAHDELQRSALVDAVKIGNIESVKRHLEGQQHLAKQALFAAARAGIPDMISVLASEYDLDDTAFTTATWIALHFNHADVVESLFDRRNHTDAEVFEIMNSCHFQAFEAQAVLAKQVNVHARDGNGCTCLHLVSTKSAVEVLIAMGADVEARDANGQTPLHRIVQRNWTKSYEWGAREAVQTLLRHGAECNAKDNQGRTPLHLVMDGNISLGFIQFLVAHGANVHSRDNGGLPPYLHELFPFQLIRLLVESGADLEMEDPKGNSVLQIAKATHERLDIEASKTIVQFVEELNMGDAIRAT